MPATVRPYSQAAKNILNGSINFPSDTIKAMLATSAYTPALDTHEFRSSVSAAEVVGTGYTARGLALTSKTLTVTPANSWGVAWAASTARTTADVVRPTAGNGFLYRATNAGTNGATQPTWPTVIGQTVVDGGVTWENIGTAICVADAADPLWTGATFTARYLIFYKDTGTDATSPLISLVELSGTNTDTVVTSGNFTYILPAVGLLTVPLA